MKIPTTFGQMQKGKKPSWDNPRIYALINAKINTPEVRDMGGGFFKKIKKMNHLASFMKKERDKQ